MNCSDDWPRGGGDYRSWGVRLGVNGFCQGREWSTFFLFFLRLEGLRDTYKFFKEMVEGQKTAQMSDLEVVAEEKEVRKHRERMGSIDRERRELEIGSHGSHQLGEAGVLHLKAISDWRKSRPWMIPPWKPSGMVEIREGCAAQQTAEKGLKRAT